MRYPGEDTVVLTRGMTERKSLSIEANAKAFRTLIDTLYSDKIQSPIRELMSNAYDSHVAAGKADIPFEVHLPAKLAPTFSVKDYGIGMTHEFVMDLFSTLYYSTKDGTIDMPDGVDPDLLTGTLGLGSKSFFGYTDSSTLTCTDGEEKRIYSLHMATGRIPDIALMARMPCKEPTSVKMEFSVKEQDFDAFYHAFKQVVLAYDVIPHVTPRGPMERFYEDNVRRQENAYIQVTDHIRRYTEGLNMYGFSGGIRVRQGTVTYPLTPKIGSHPNVKLCLELLSLGGKSGNLHVIDFPLGSLGFQPSREGLEETDENIKRIVAKLEEMAHATRDQLLEDIKSLPTIQHKLVYCKERFGNFDRVTEILELNSLRTYMNYVSEFEKKIKSQYTDEDYSWRRRRRSPASDFKEVTEYGKTTALKLDSFSGYDYTPSKWWECGTIIINDVYDKIGVALKDHVSQAKDQLYITYAKEKIDLTPEDVFSGKSRDPRSVTQRTLDYSEKRTLIFFNTTKEALQKYYPAAKIHYLSEFTRVRPERPKIPKGTDSRAKALYELDATDRMVLLRRTLSSKEKGYFLVEYDREIRIDLYDLIHDLNARGIDYIVAHGRHYRDVKNLDKRVTLDDYLRLRMHYITEKAARDHCGRVNYETLWALPGINMGHLVGLRKYIPDALAEKMLPAQRWTATEYDSKHKITKMKVGDTQLTTLTNALCFGKDTPDPYIQFLVEEKVRAFGFQICPPGEEKNYFRPSELTFLRFLCSVHDVITSLSNKTGAKEKKPETKYMKSIFTNLEEFLMDLKTRLERKYDAANRV